MEKSKMEVEMEAEVLADRKPKKTEKKQAKPKTGPKKFKVSIPEGHILNVRAEASTDAEITGTLKAGEEVTGYGVEKDFTIIRFRGKPAYVMTSKLIEE